MKRTKIAVLMGGRSPEHQISLLSGKEVIANLNPQKYHVLPIVVSKDGKSFLFQGRSHLLGQLSIVNCQLFFIAMHGPFGEDGTIQGFLDLINIPYTGSGVLASALGMDKIYSLKIFTQENLKVPKYMIVEKSQIPKLNMEFPVFIKPANHGSSIGVSKVTSKSKLKRAIELALKYSPKVLIQEFIEGTEITCAILGNEEPIALPLVEITPKKEFFDYEAKYNSNLADEIVPARVSQQLTQKAKQTALIAYQSIGCRGFGRVDMIIKDNAIYVLEVNTIPGLTPVSLFPKAAAAAGISYPQLLDKIIGLALNR